MRQTTIRRLHRLPVALIAACSIAIVLPAAAGAAASCAHSTELPANLSAQQLRETTLCVLNQERADGGLRPLRLDTRLGRAAAGHSRDMVAHRYFAHDSRSGARFSARIARTGWMTGRGRWTVGENLAWGSGSESTPRAIVSAWMRSAPHRANILKPQFRLIGIGIKLGVPVGPAARGATYTTDFGS